VEGYFPRIIRKPDTAYLGDAILFAVHHKTVQVEIFPAYGDLEDVVEIGDAAVAAHEDAPPDGGADFKQQDVELVDFDRARFC